MKTFIKTSIISILVGVLGFNLVAQTADQDVANGLALLASHDVVDLVAANQQFTSALALSPTNEPANALAAVTRLLLLPSTPAGSNFLNSIGLARAGRNPYDWTSFLPTNTSGGTVLPSENTAVAVALYRTNVMAALAASRTNLAMITDPNFTLSLTADETSLDAVTVDYGDFLLMQAAERVAEFAGYTANAHNGDVVLTEFHTLKHTSGLTLQNVLKVYPDLLMFADTNDLAASKGALTNAIALYFTASDFIRNVRAPGAPALFVLSDDETNDEAIFRTELTNALASLNGPVTFTAPDSPATNSVTINAGNYFTGTKSPRSLLPQFNGDVYVADSLPDYTFGGILVNEPAYLTEEVLRKVFHTPPVASHMPVITKNLPADLTAEVGTNLAISLTATGSPPMWYQWYSNSVPILYANSNVLVLRQLQFSAAGTYSVTVENIAGQTNSSPLNLTVICNSTPPTNDITSPTPGKQVSNALWTVTGKAGGNAVVSNVLVQINGGGWNPATTANGWANWTIPVPLIPGSNTVQAYAVDTCDNVSRTNTVNFKYIVSAPLTVQIVGEGTVNPDLNGQWLPLGANFSMTATADKGFAFSYWSVGAFMTNKPTLLYPMASNLVVIAHFLDVTKPTNEITFPTANLKWSNTNITVTGKAGDNVGVAGVGVQINQGGWLAAQTLNGYTNWSAPNLPVMFGTNTVQAYAQDAAGNVSPTNVVKFLGVVTPASLTGYAATLKPSIGKQEITVAWGDGTWSQAGLGGDTNADDYCAGVFAYIQTGPNTAVVSNMDVGMMSDLGNTNFTTVNLTFTNATTASVTWTDNLASGSGTMTFMQVSNTVPASLAGSTIKVYTNGVLVVTTTFTNDVTFGEVEAGGTVHAGNYTFTQYSPTAAILELNYTDTAQTGAETFSELTFTSAAGGEIFESYYDPDNQANGSNPDHAKLGTFKLATP